MPVTISSLDSVLSTTIGISKHSVELPSDNAFYFLDVSTHNAPNRKAVGKKKRLSSGEPFNDWGGGGGDVAYLSPIWEGTARK